MRGDGWGAGVRGRYIREGAGEKSKCVAAVGEKSVGMRNERAF